MRAAAKRLAMEAAAIMALALTTTAAHAQANTNYYYYDPFGRLTGTTEYVGQENSYTYDSADNRSNVTGAKPAWAFTSNATFLVPGQIMLAGEQILSPDGQHSLVFQNDHNLVLYHGANIWQSGTANMYYGGATLSLTSNGYLQMWDAQHQHMIWSPPTSSQSGTIQLALLNSGNLVLMANGIVYWQSYTTGR